MLSIGFLVYIVLLYVCVIFIYDTKRKIDDKELNKNLELFQARNEAGEDEL